MSNNEPLDPFTGLPEKKDKNIDPFTGLESKPVSQRGARPALTAPTMMNLRGTPSSYQDYGVPVIPGLDIEEMRAQRQSNAEKWGRGLMKAGVTMVGAIAENTVGLMDGIGEAISQGDWTKIYDNETGRAIDSMNAWMQENYPNYYTKKEQNAIGFENLGYANFWGDKAANGLGYAVASVGTLYFTGGVGLLAKGAGLAAKGVKAASKSLGMYNAAKSMATGAKIGQKISSGARRAKAINAAKTAEVGIAMSHAEASVEAREMLNHAYSQAALDIAEARGVSVQELTAAERQEARELASSIGNYGYAFNMAVLAPTNLFMFGKGLSPKYGKMRTKAKGYRQDKLGKWKDTWAAENSPMWKRTASRYLSKPTENAISETFQEGTQYAIQKAGEASLEKGGASGLLDFTSSVIGGWEDTLTEKEGIESLMLGFIIGGFMGGVGSARSRWNQAEEDKGRAKIINALNSEQMYTLAEKAEHSKKQEEYSQVMQKALEDGDHKTYRDAQFRLVLSQIMMHDGAGTMDMYLQKIDDAKRMEPAEFAKAFGIPEGVEFDQARIASDLTKDVNKFLEMKEKVELMFPSSQKMGLAKLLSKKEATEEEKQQAIDENRYKSILIMEGLRLEDNDSRIEKLTAELNNLFTPLEQEQRAEAERLVKRLQYNSSKIRRLEKKKRTREKEFGKEDEAELAKLKGELQQAKTSLEAQAVESESLEADKQDYKKRSTDPESLVSEPTALLEEDVRKRILSLVNSISDPIKKVEALVIAGDLIGLASDRTMISFALEELLTDPEERASFINRERAAKEKAVQDEIDKYAEEQIENTNTAEEITAILKVAQDKKLSPEARKKLHDERKNRKLNEAAIHQRLNEDDLSVLEVALASFNRKAASGTPLTPEEIVERHVLAETIKHRTKEGLIKGNRSRRKAKKEAEDKKAAAAAAAAAAAEAEKRKNKEDQTKDASKGTTTAGSENTGDSRAPKRTTKKARIQNGELATGENKKTVKFDDNGFPIEGTDKDRDFKIDREYLKTEEGHDAALNSEVEFVLNNETFEKDGKMVTEPVIYVKLGDRYIGILPAHNKDPQSNRILMSLMEGNPTAGRISTIGYSGSGNFINEVKDGVPVLKPMSELFKDGKPEGFVSYGYVTEEGVEIVGEGVSEEVLNAASNAVSLRRTKNDLGNGQIVMIFKFPNGDYTAIPITTKETGVEGLAAIREYILDSDVSNLENSIKSVAGLPIWQRAFSKFTVEVTEQGVPLISFFHKDKAVKLSIMEMRNLLQDKPVNKFSIGNLVSREVEGQQVVVFENDETASTSDYIALKDGMRASFEEAVKSTRRQVNPALLAVQDKYTDPVTKKVYTGGYAEFIESELLSTQVRFHKGLPTFDHQIEIDLSIQNEQPQQAADAAKVKPEPKGKKENKAAPKEPGVGQGSIHSSTGGNTATGEASQAELAALESLLDEKVTDEPSKQQLESRSQEGPKAYIDKESGSMYESVVDAIVDNSNNLELTEDGKYYRHKKTGELYMRATTFIGSKETFDPKWSAAATAIGNSVDQFLRDYFAGRVGSNSYPNLSQEAQDELSAAAENLKTLFEGRGEKVLEDDITLSFESKEANSKDGAVVGVAGTVDLMTQDKNGNFRIYDIKSLREATVSKAIYKNDKPTGTKGVRVTPNGKYGPRMDEQQRSTYQQQLSIYKALAENKFGVTVSEISVVPVDVKYPSPENKTVEEASNIQATSAALINPIVQKPLTIKGLEPGKQSETSTESIDSINQRFSTEIENLSTLAELAYSEGLFEEADKFNAERDALIAEYKKLTGKDYGTAYRLGSASQQKIDKERAISWLRERFGDDSVTIYNQLKMVGDNVVHGYMENGAVHLFSQAEVGTEYHEGFHLFFRTLLTNRQRSDLYRDAADIFGEPTAKDIAKARRGQREMTDEEARNLALEEKLAEEFRDFVLTEQKPKTMGRRIAKFFKDLLIYIKALAGYPMTVRSAFSMIESNRIPKSYSRTAETFSPGGTAFLMQHFVSDPKLGKEIRDLVVYKVINALDANSEIDIQDLLGSPATANTEGGDSVIADWFLRSALKVNAPLGSRALKDREFAIIKKVYFDPEKMSIAMNAMHVQFGAPELTAENELMPDQMLGENTSAYSKLFLEVYEHWHDKRSELGGVEVRGYRSEIRDRLRDYGFKTYDSEQTRKAEDIEDNDEGADRIYSVSRSKEDPAKTLGDKARRALSRIPVQSTEGSRLGFQTFIPIEDVYKQIAATAVDSTNWVDMLSALEEKANEISSLKEVYDFMVKLEAKEKALMYSVFAQAMTPYKLIKLEVDDKGNKVVKIINSSENSIQRYFAQKWKDESTGSGGLYTPGVNSSGDLLDLKIDEERRAKAESLYGKLETAMQESPDGIKQYQLLGELLLEMGITIASTTEEAGRRVQIAFEKDKIGMYNFLTKDTKIRSMFTSNGKMTKKVLNNYSNIFETESSTMNAVSQIIMSKFEAPSSTSFFNGLGNLVYPINLKSDMNITTELIKSEGEDNLAAVMYGKGTDGGVVGSVVKGSEVDTRSLAYMFISNKNGQETFELVDIDSFAADENSAKEFEGFTYKDGLSVDLAMFAQSNKVRYVAVDTQGDRSKLTYMPIPNFRNSDVAAMYGFDIGQESDPVAAGIERTYLLDLHRMYVAEKAKDESLIETYHSKNRYLSFQLGGSMDAESPLLVDAYVHLEKGFPMSPDLKKAVESYVSDTKKKMTEYRQDIVAELGGEENLKSFVTSTIKGGSKGNYGGYIKGEEIAYIDEFIEMSVLGRMMSREILRSGVNYVKNGADYVKRSALSSTPGTQLFTISMNNDPNNADYGMWDEFREITLNDIAGSISTKDRADLKAKLVDQVGEAAAEGIISSYDESNGTDAQAVISVHMYRRIRMGLGQWSEVDEQVYKEYIAAPIGQRKWDGARSPIMPLKPSYDYRVEHKMGGHRHLLPISHKNSYVVLTDELAEGIPNLQNLANYFEANNVHVANTISAKKLASFQPVDITDLANAKVQTVPSRGLKFPQILPSKKAQKITFGRQPRKNMIANINPADSYYLEDMGMEVSGRDLINMYQKAVIAKLNKGHADVTRRLGYDKVLEARELGDINAEAKAMQDMLPNLREALTELGIEKDLPQNIMDSVNVIVDANGVITTEVPLAFPTVQNKLDSLIMGLFRSSAYMQKLTGVEMVQFAEFGGTEKFSGDKEDAALKFYSIEEATDSEGNTYSKIAAAEVDIRRDVLEAMGVDPDASISEIEESVNKMLGYRIPQQGKSSMLMMKIRKVLPNSHSKAVRIPPAVTTMMGSDFDIDKMFVIFPEVNIEGKKNVRVTKVKPDYNALKTSTQEQFEELDEKVLNNIVFDTFMAIGSSVKHIHESMTPLDIKESVDPILQGIVGIGYENPHVEIDINSPHDRIRSATDNMLSMSLRGIYANTIAGRNVALTAMSMGEFTFEGPQFKVDGVTVGNLVEKSLFTDPLGVYRFTDYYMSQYLSKSVDSVKDPVQRLMNDNSLTAPITSYMLSIGMTPQQIIAFLNVGAVREVIDGSVKSNRSIKQGVVGYKPAAMDLNLAEMQAIASGANTEYKKSDYVQMLAFVNEEAKKLRNLYTILSPDNIDQAGTTPQHLAKIERALTTTEKADDIVFGGRDALKNVTEGEAYPIVKAYYSAINRSVELTTALGFIGTQPAVVSFKESLKDLTGLDYLNDVQHRDINRAILHHLVTKPGSPIFEKGLLDAPYIRDRFAVRGGLESVMNLAKKAVGESVNPVFDAFTLEQEEVNGFPFYYLKVDKSKLSTKEEKDRFTYTMQGMMDNPALYGEDNRDIVRDAIRVIITNSILTSGFAPGMKSYFELIPVSFWRNLGVTEHLNQEMNKINTNERALDDFKSEFLMNYGTHSSRKETLFPRDKGRFGERFVEAGNEILPYITSGNDAFRISLAGNKKILYQRSDYIPASKNYRYIPVATKGKQYVLYEAYLREPTTGKKVKGSLFDNEQSIMLPRPSSPFDAKISSQRVGTGQRETPKGAAQKIARLRENFAKAGIDVKIVETELPLGTKGQVQGDTVYVDPAQMETDTVYHEFAHILIDMMPEDQVDTFIDQVIKADPALAKSVKAKYPELEGRELGKEILVTAIGLQGAKIERNNPSKLRILINKILRAIGKVFGVSPNVAAVLAEEMFAGDMRAEGLSGQFNPKLQKSKDLKDKMGTVYKQVRDSLARQRFRLNQLAKTETRESKLRELDGLIQNIDELNEKAESKITDLNEFYDFYEYVVGRTDILNSMMEDLLQEVKSGVPLTRDEMFSRLNKIDSIRQTLESLYTEDESTSTVVQMTGLLRTLRDEGDLENLDDEVKELLFDLSESMEKLRDLNKMYMDTVVPLTTNALLSYASPETAAQIEAEKKRVQESNDLSGFRPMKFGASRAMSIPEFKALNSEYYTRKNTDSAMSREEFNERAMEIKLRYIENKMVGAAQITQELTEAQKSKSKFSYWLDPIVYSRQQNLQLFALAVKDALYKANEDTINFTYNLENKYNAFKEWKGGSEFNQEKLNEDILTTVKVRKGDRTVKALSLVQEFDIDKYYSNYYSFLDNISEKYNKPSNEDSQETWKEWYMSSDGKSWAEAKQEWFAENTEPVEGAEEKFKAVVKEMNAIEDRMKMLEVEGNPKNREQLIILRSDFYKLEARRKKMGYYAPQLVEGEVKFIAMGELAQPKKAEYQSDKYKKITETPELKAYYDFIVSEYHKAQAKLGDTQQQVNSWDKYSYVMPTIRKDGMGTLFEDGWKELAKEQGRDFRRLDTDTEFGLMTEVDGQEIRGIPKYYTQVADQKNVSRDVAASMTQFIHMSNNYQQKSSIAGLVHSMLVIHEKKGVVKHQGGLPIRDQIAGMSRKANELVVSRDESDNNDLKHLRDFVESVFYGVSDTTASFGSISQAKTAGKLVGATAVVGLAGNLLQIGNQAILDNLMTGQEAFAKQFFTPEDWGKAIAIYTSEGAALRDVGSFVPKGKLAKAMQMFDALNEVTDSLGQNIGGSKARKFFSKDTLFALQHGVEHETAGIRMLAVMTSITAKDKNGKPILNEDGKEANLWDMLVEKENGQLAIDPRVANVDKSRVIAKIHGIAKRTNQVKGSFDSAMAQRTTTGKLLLLFRNYFIPGLRKRYGHGDMYQVDHELGEVTKGYYQTFANSLRDVVETGSLKAILGSSEIDKQNMKRVAIDAATIATTMLLYSMMQGFIDDDDEDYTASFIAYQALRLQTEVTGFFNPVEAVRMAARPMATINFIEDYLKLAESVLYTTQYETGIYFNEEKVAKGALYQRRSGPYEKGDYKLTGRIEKVLPLLRTWKTMPLAEGSAKAVQDKLRWFV